MRRAEKTRTEKGHGCDW